MLFGPRFNHDLAIPPLSAEEQKTFESARLAQQREKSKANHKALGGKIRESAHITEWSLQGKLHREDGPAVELNLGSLSNEPGEEEKLVWYNHGQMHRNDGPAVVDGIGNQEWWITDKLHRTDGPAVVRVEFFWFAHGSQQGKTYQKMWFQNGIRHRTDGPAVEKSTYQGWVKQGSQGDHQKHCEYWIKGRPITKQEFDEMK